MKCIVELFGDDRNGRKMIAWGRRIECADAGHVFDPVRRKVATCLFVDDVVNTGNGKTYIQSAYRLAGADKIEQETRGLRKIGDSFRKIVVVDGVQPFYTDESGVSFVSLMDFMLNRDILG